MKPLPVLALAFATACSSVDPYLEARVQRELTRMQAGFQKLEPAPAAGGPFVEPWAPGQFAIWRITQGDETTLVSAQIEESDGRGVSVMVIELSPRLRTTARLSFARQPRGRDEAAALLTQVIRRRGEEASYTYGFGPDTRTEMRDALAPLWGMLFPTPESGSAETVTTPAATLQGAQPARGLVDLGPYGLEVRGHVHPAVPISGLAEAAAVRGKGKLELMEYGWSGGAPAL